MPKSRAYRWNGWRTDLNGGSIKDRPVKSKPKKPKGITNDQAKYLAKLQRSLGEPFSGRGMTAADADAAIKKCAGELRARKALSRSR